MQQTNEELALQAKQGDIQAAHKLWEQNKGITFLLFRRLYNNPISKQRAAAAGVTLEDIDQQSFFVVLDAVKGYNPDSGLKFTAYLKYPIMKYFFELVGFRTAGQRKKLLNNAASLNEPVNTDGEEDYTLLDTIEDIRATDEMQSAEHKVWIEQLHNDLERALNKLNEPQQQAIRARYYGDKTLQEIADSFGVTPELVRQRIKKAVRELRRDKILKQYREDIITTHAFYHVGFSAWEHLGSVQEITIEWLQEHGIL